MKTNPPTENDEKYLQQKLSTLFNNPLFVKDVEQLRQQLGIVLTKNRVYRRRTAKVWDASAKLAVKYHKHSGWEMIIQDYILQGTSFDDPDTPIIDNGNGQQIDPETEERIYSLIIFPKTTLKDVETALYSLKPENLRRVRKKVKSESTRDAKIFQLNLEGKSTREIRKVVISEFGVDLDLTNIERIITEQAKALGISRRKFRAK